MFRCYAVYRASTYGPDRLQGYRSTKVYAEALADELRRLLPWMTYYVTTEIRRPMPANKILGPRAAEMYRVKETAR